ncbi:MAG: putative Fe-S protein YdhL (DUF1289 family) [Glaciecola sp.]|jgi:predicted Fe-S protein YdhL (DUF1289 family)
MKNHTEVESPCVRNCCLDQQDMCLGCFRSITEILEWSNASTEKRSEIIGLTLQRKEKRQ